MSNVRLLSLNLKSVRESLLHCLHASQCAGEVGESQLTIRVHLCQHLEPKLNHTDGRLIGNE